jgi:uncharacterized protein YidB (DUF937 family)
MGLLDDVLKQAGALTGGGTAAGSQGAGLLSLLNGALAGQGGLQGLVQQFQQGGLGNVISSWIGTGANLPVTADQLKQVLGSDGISRIASQLGLPSQDVGAKLTEVLPGLVDKVTPNGTLPPSELLGKAFNFLKR